LTRSKVFRNGHALFTVPFRFIFNHGYKRKEHSYHRGAKTFRRGRAIIFLEMMNINRSTSKQQLNKPEFQSINKIIIGELKALDMVINEFSQLFEIQEHEVLELSVRKIKKRI